MISHRIIGKLIGYIHTLSWRMFRYLVAESYPIKMVSEILLFHQTIQDTSNANANAKQR